eukprot:EG_transcript_22091
MPRPRRLPAARPQGRGRQGTTAVATPGVSAVHAIDITDSEDDSDFSMDSGSSGSEMDFSSFDNGTWHVGLPNAQLPGPLGFFVDPLLSWMIGGGGGDDMSNSDMSEDEEDDTDDEANTADDEAAGGEEALPLDEFSISSPLADHTKLPADHRTCLVCQEDFKSGETTRRLNCFHLFHTKCVDKWLQRHPSCPICKHRFTRERMEADEEALMQPSRSQTQPRSNPRRHAPRIGTLRAPSSRSSASSASSSSAGLSPSSNAGDGQTGVRLRSGRQLPALH